MDKTSSFQIILLSVLGAFFMGGVILFALASAGSKTSSIGSVVIWGTLDENTFNDVVHAASEQDNRLAGVTYVMKDPSTFETDLTDALASGKGPDLILLSQDYAFRNKDKVQPFAYTDISLTQFQGAFIDAASPFTDSDGIIGIPILADPLVLFWNSDILAAGGHAIPPAFWDEVVGDVRDVTKQSDTGAITRSGINFGGYDNIQDAKDIVTTLIMQAGNPITRLEQSGALNVVLAPEGGDSSSETVDALTFYTQFADPTQPMYTWNGSLPESRTMFANGDLGLYVGHSSEALIIAKKNPNLRFSIAALPQIRVGQKIPLTSATVYALAVANNTKNMAGARTVASLLATDAITSELAARYNMASALRKTVSAQATGDQDLINKQAILAKAWIDPDPEQTNALFQSMITDVVNGAAKVQEAAQRADKAISTLINP